MIVLEVDLQEDAYAKKLVLYLNAHMGDPYEVRLKKDQDLSDPDLILTDQISYGEQIHSKRGGGVILFCEAGEASACGWHGPCLDPYLSGTVMIRQLKKIAGDMISGHAVMDQRIKSGNTEATQIRGKLWAVYSPIGGVGKTTLAVTLCDILARRNPESKVLYLNLEGISDWRSYFRNETNYNLSDFLYLLLLNSSGKENTATTLKHMVTKQGNGVYFISPCNGEEDLEILTESEIEKMLVILLKNFDMVVCDMNSMLYGPNLWILKRSHMRFFLYTSTCTGMAKWQDFMRSLSRMHLEQTLLDGRTKCLCVLPFGSGKTTFRNRKDPRERKADLELYEDRELYTEKDGFYFVKQSTDWYQRISQAVSDFLKEEKFNLVGDQCE